MNMPSRPAPQPQRPSRHAVGGQRMIDNHGAGAVPPTVAELSDLVAQMRDLMLEEISLLDRHVYDGFDRLTERKQVIAGLLREKQQVLKQHPDSLLETPEGERKAFEALLADMKAVGKKNEMVIRVARDANKMLLDAIIRGATKQSQLGTGYGRNGAMTSLTTNYGARQPVSLFSNESC
ncbi:hypothetical protein [Ferrovibrio sp.]|uniref:hypothetical protein n=1 Tax=Ferrovibrio sp. TaxID=1917215 RepID=UPI00311FA66A